MTEQSELQEDNYGLPVKPFSPVLRGSLFFWAGCAFAYWVLKGYEMACVPALLAFCAGGLCFAFKKGWSGLISQSVLALICGLALGSAGATAMFQQIHTLENTPSTEAIIVVSTDSQSGTYGNYCVAYIYTGGLGLYKARLYTSDAQEYFFGETFRATVTFSAPSETAYDSYWSKGLAGSAKFSKAPTGTRMLTPFTQARKNFIQRILDYDSESSRSALLCALACGYRSALNQSELYTDFQLAGLAHVVAVSGAHLSIMCAFLALLLRKLRISKRASIGIQLAGMLVYLICSGIPISAFRAAVMVTLSLLSFFSKRRAASQNALGVCVVVFLILNPADALSVSLALSALSTLGILMLSSDISAGLHRLFHDKASFVADSLSLTLSASSTTLLLSGALFSQISLISLWSNVVVGLAFAPLCGICLLVAFSYFLGIVPVVELLLQPALVFCEALSKVVGLLAHVPYACVPFSISILPALVLTIALFLTLRYRANFPHRLHYLSATVMIMMITPLISFVVTVLSPVQLCALDVGQGDALLVKDGFQAVLIDTGREDTLLKSALAQQGITHLSCVFITHPDQDHCGSLDALLQVVQVDSIAVPQALLDCTCDKCQNLESQIQASGCRVVGLKVGQEITLGRTKLTVLWPNDYQDQGGNSDSLCIRAQFDADSDGSFDYAALLVGDAESETLEELLKQHLLNDVDIFKVGHHGSRKSCSESVLNTIQPEVALISVGANNDYGHPTAEALSLLEECHAAVFRTDLLGTIVCSFKEDGIHVSSID